MVNAGVTELNLEAKFQYSLCRVVLMVSPGAGGGFTGCRVSVLALSSRFDGRPWVGDTHHVILCFSTRSVESF